MIYCFDTYYTEEFANTAVVGIQNWHDTESSFEFSEKTTEIQEYESGSFYKRELPCLLSIIKKIPLNAEQDILVIDGYVILSDDGKPGLGGYLFEELGEKYPVIGIAKNDFVSLQKNKSSVLRGESKHPLYVTSLGMSLEEATMNVSKMHGEFRIPTILKLVDQRSRLI